jgi:undecaprenol kinase
MKSPSLIKSLAHAWRGLRLCFKTERSFRIQIAGTLMAFGAAAVLPLETWERVMIVFVVMTILVLELINSSLERLVDLVKPRLHEYVGDIKDLMAGAVLIAACAAIVIGYLLFSPHVIDSLRRL